MNKINIICPEVRVQECIQYTERFLCGSGICKLCELCLSFSWTIHDFNKETKDFSVKNMVCCKNLNHRNDLIQINTALYKIIS
jgi:hypothetical protein